MTTLHVHWIGEQAVLPKAELERLIELARRSEEVDVQGQVEELPAAGLRWLAEKGGAFDFLAEDGEQYSVDDLKVRYR